MNIYIAFPNHRFVYYCNTCPADCCHVANTVIMNEDQYKIAIKENGLLSTFTSEQGSKYYLKVGKKCWFLKDNLCSIHKNYGEQLKPMSCQLYPIRVWKFSNELLIAEYIPCPDFYVNPNKKGVSHTSVENYIRNYHDILDLPVRSFPDINENGIQITEERLESEKYIRDYFPECMIDQPIDELFQELDSEQFLIAENLVWLYPQLRFSPYILNLPFHQSLNTIKEFISTLIKISEQDWGDGGKQNAFVALLDFFNREIIRNYY